MSKVRLYRALVLALVLATGSVQAHHSRSAFALDQTIQVSGEVVEVGWTNPHYYLALRDQDEREWTFEGHSIPGLVRNGWNRNTVKVGDQVAVTVNPNKQRDVLFGLLNSVVLSSGATYYSFKPQQPVPPPEVMPSTDFSGTWRLIRSLKANLVSADGAPLHWPLNEQSRLQASLFDATEDPSLQCQPRGLPRMLDWPYAQHWTNTPEGIQIDIEHATETRRMWHERPAVLSDQQGLGTSVIKQRNKHELIVETAGFEPKHWGLSRGLNSSARKVVREHYQLLDGGLRLQLNYSVTDPEFLNGPGGETFYFAKVEDYTFAAEPPCDISAAQRHLKFQ